MKIHKGLNYPKATSQTLNRDEILNALRQYRCRQANECDTDCNNCIYGAKNFEVFKELEKDF